MTVFPKSTTARRVSRLALVASLWLALLAACSSGSRSGVGLTVDADASVDDLVLASVTVLSVRVSGDETYRHDIALDRVLHRREGLLYSPLATSRALTVELDALDVAGKVVATASTGVLQLTGDATLRVEVVLRAPPSNNDPCGVDPSPPTGDVIAAHCAIDSPPVIDGKLEDWSQAVFTPLTHANAAVVLGSKAWPGTSAGDDGDLSGSFAARWDRDFLYIAFQVRDDIREVHPETTGFFAADAVEMFVDGIGDRTNTYNEDDHHLIIRVDGAVQEAKNSSIIPTTVVGMVVKQADTGVAASWSMEVALPWTNLGPAPAAVSRQLGFDFQLDDCDTSAMAQLDHALVWVLKTVPGCSQPNCSTATFGRIQLTGR